MVDFAIHNAWLIPLLPAISFVLIAFFFQRAKALSAFTSIVCILAAFTLAISVVIGIIHNPETVEYSVRWFSIENVASLLDANVPSINLEIGILIDPITAMMLFVVTLVASLVQIYSVGYMHGDPGYSSYFAYQSLFAMSMLGLVLSNNFLMIFMFWELVGLCSYLLIGFWFGKYSAREAAKKAFITNRVGDFGLLLGILMIQVIFGTLNFLDLQSAIGSYTNMAVLTVITLLVLCGPIGKSAQFPLHVWLPDAMEGPTPVSALIHAATMVVAGVYLIARAYFLFSATETGLTAVAYVGGFTALFAASIAIAQDDIKRILAFSTLSQLGYMVMALGLASLTAGMFHLMTHAFFKALLFLGSGSVIHALHEKQNIWDMGGLSKKMPVTTWTFVIGALAIAGIFPLAGFWSKDEILLAAYAGGHTGFYILGSFVAFLTAFYMFRLVFTAFFGKAKPENHPHESPFSMALPLVILAFFSIVGGLVGIPGLEHGFGHYVHAPGAEHHAPSMMVMVSSTIIAVAGITLAWVIYAAKLVSADRIAATFRPVYLLLKNKYYIDEIYQWVIDNIVDGLGKVMYWVDIYIVNGIVNGTAFITRWLGGVFRFVQTGRTQDYALIIFSAVVLIALFLVYNNADQVITVVGGVLK